MMEIRIAHHLIRAYLNTITWLWADENMREVAETDIIPNEMLNPGSIMLTRLKEKVPLELALRYLKNHPGTPMATYNGAEFDWADDSMLRVVDQVLERWFAMENPKVKALQANVVLVELPLAEWRATIKPIILKMLKNQGIEP